MNFKQTLQDCSIDREYQKRMTHVHTRTKTHLLYESDRISPSDKVLVSSKHTHCGEALHVSVLAASEIE